MKKYEILAPVGAEEQLRAAVINGANAVYLGTGNFNARRNADNFSGNSLKNAVDYCHLRGVKVYVTLNTLIFDKEMESLYSTVKDIALSGADAVIVQDFAVVDAVKRICPALPLHASTQMAVHNISGAKFLETLGFSRIVLARELSLNEIKKIREAVKTELEVFVHGAHCMSASGNCYLSAMLGERSGNRGLCAQGCRLNWKNNHGREFALSLKDMSYIDNINDLKKIGVDSFKIEGRMKRPEYVAAAVKSFKNALESKEYNKDILQAVFSRSGFTDGYLKGNRTTAMFGYRNKEDVISAGGVLKELQITYQKDIHPTPLNATLRLKENEPSQLTVFSMGKQLTVAGDVAEEPRNAPLSEEIAKRSMGKLGDTPFFLNDFIFENLENLTLSASSINALRREATEKLAFELTKVKREIFDYLENESLPNIQKQTDNFRIRLQSFSQYSEIFKNAQFIILPIDEIIKNREIIKNFPEKIIAELPQLIYPDSEAVISEKLVEIKKAGIIRGITGNIGGIEILKKAGFIIHGSHGLNITNSHALNFYKSQGLEDTVLSFELTLKAMEEIDFGLSKGAYIYGYLPLMLFRACPQTGESGCEKCTGFSYLTDRKNVKFPLVCHNKQYSVLHNSVPLYVGDKALKNLDFKTLYFTIENKSQCEEIYKSALHNTTIRWSKTNGLMYRELL